MLSVVMLSVKISKINMTENEKNILLFLTQINRRMKNSGNNKTTIKWVKECKECVLILVLMEYAQ